MRLVRKDLSEVRELEPLVIDTIDQIETGLQALDNQIHIGESGRPDIYAVDSNGTFTIIELKSVEADFSTISQGIRYYEWFINNLALVARSFPKIKPNQGVRLMFVAPAYEDNTVRLAKYISLDITFVKYIGLEDKKTKEIGITYEILDLQPEDGPKISFNSVDDIIDHLVDNEVKSEFKIIINDLLGLGIIVKPFKGGKNNWIECTYNNEDVVYFRTRQKFFQCQTYDEKTDEYIWPPFRLTTYKQWKDQCRKIVLKTVELTK